MVDAGLDVHRRVAGTRSTVGVPVADQRAELRWKLRWKLCAGSCGGRCSGRWTSASLGD